jgi:hypothetical protein
MRDNFKIKYKYMVVPFVHIMADWQYVVFNQLARMDMNCSPTPSVPVLKAYTYT